MLSSYSYELVALSVVIAIMASYVALDLAGRVTATTGRARLAWISGGAFAMGTGIWSMHYIGMAAMRLPATHHYAPAVVAASVVLAIAISFVALWLTFHLREGLEELDRRKIGSAIVMGVAIPVMHYTGMAAVTFTPAAMTHGDLLFAVGISSLGLIGIVGVTFMVLGLAVLSALMDRRRSAQLMREDARLRESEARLRHDAERREFILSAAAMGLWEQDLTTGLVTWSDTMEVIYNIPRSEFPKALEAFLALIHPDDHHEIERAFTHSVQTGADYAAVYRSVGADGSIHWVESTARVSHDGAGHPTRIVGVDRDITGRKLADAALVESERAYRSAFEGAPVGIAHVSLDGHWLRVNRRLCKMLGYPRATLLTLDILGLMHPEDREQESRALQNLASGTVDEYHSERRLRHRDGTFIWTELSISVHRDEAGNPKYIIPIIDDITERPRASERGSRPDRASRDESRRQRPRRRGCGRHGPHRDRRRRSRCSIRHRQPRGAHGRTRHDRGQRQRGGNGSGSAGAAV